MGSFFVPGPDCSLDEALREFERVCDLTDSTRASCSEVEQALALNQIQAILAVGLEIRELRAALTVVAGEAA